MGGDRGRAGLRTGGGARRSRLRTRSRRLTDGPLQRGHAAWIGSSQQGEDCCSRDIAGAAASCHQADIGRTAGEKTSREDLGAHDPDTGRSGASVRFCYGAHDALAAGRNERNNIVVGAPLHGDSPAVLLPFPAPVAVGS